MKKNQTNKFLFLLILLLFYSWQTWADPSSSGLPPMLTINEPPPLKVYWKERGDEILLDSVCFDYAPDSAENKGCRKLAIQKFRDECQRFTKSYHDSRPYYVKSYKVEMDKFCTAATEFKP